MKACLYNFDPLKPHFYIVKLGFTGVNIIFLILAQKYRLWVPVRTALPRKNMKNIRVFSLSENFQFLEVKFSIHLTIFGLIRVFGKDGTFIPGILLKYVRVLFAHEQSLAPFIFSHEQFHQRLCSPFMNAHEPLCSSTMNTDSSAP